MFFDPSFGPAKNIFRPTDDVCLFQVKNETLYYKFEFLSMVKDSWPHSLNIVPGLNKFEHIQKKLNSVKKKLSETKLVFELAEMD